MYRCISCLELPAELMFSATVGMIKSLHVRKVKLWLFGVRNPSTDEYLVVLVKILRAFRLEYLREAPARLISNRSGSRKKGGINYT